MDNPAVIGDDQVKDCQEDKDKPAPEAKPGRSGYVKPVPKDAKSSKKPCLKIVLTSDGSPKPKEVSKVVLQGNVKTVTVLKKADNKTTTPFTPVLEKVKVDKDGVVFLPTPIKMAELKVILEEAKSDKADTFNTTLKVHACGHFPSKLLRSVYCSVKLSIRTRFLFKFGHTMQHSNRPPLFTPQNLPQSPLRRPVLPQVF